MWWHVKLATYISMHRVKRRFGSRKVHNVVSTEERLWYWFNLYMFSRCQVHLGDKWTSNLLKRTFTSNWHELTSICTAEKQEGKRDGILRVMSSLCGWRIGCQSLTWKHNEGYWIGILHQRQQVWYTQWLLGCQYITIPDLRRDIRMEHKVRLLCCGVCANDQRFSIWV